MRTELDRLRAANPVTEGNARAWLNTEEARHAHIDALEGGVAIDRTDSGRSSRARWLIGLASAVAVVVLALPLLLRPDGALSPPTSTASTVPAITAAEGVDPFYVDLVRCIADQAGMSFGELEVNPNGSPTDSGQSVVDKAAAMAPEALARCHQVLSSDESVTQETARLFPGAISIPEVRVSVVVPESWQSTNEDLTPIVTGPQEAISLATFPMEAGGDSCAHVPVQALEDMSAEDIFIQILNGTGSDPLPPTFAGRVVSLPQGEHLACVAPGERGDIGSLGWTSFSDSGHGFYLMVTLGSRTTPEQVHMVERVLDSITIVEVDVSTTTPTGGSPVGWSADKVSFQVREGSSYEIRDNHLLLFG